MNVLSSKSKTEKYFFFNWFIKGKNGQVKWLPERNSEPITRFEGRNRDKSSEIKQRDRQKDGEKDGKDAESEGKRNVLKIDIHVFKSSHHSPAMVTLRVKLFSLDNKMMKYLFCEGFEKDWKDKCGWVMVIPWPLIEGHLYHIDSLL